MSKRKKPQKLLCAGNMYDISNKKINKDEIKNIVIPYIFENKIEAYTPLLLIKSDVLKKVKSFREDIHMMEDLLFYLDLLLNIDSIYFYDYPFYHYLFYSSSSSKNRANLIRNFKDVLKVVGIIEGFLSDNNFGDKVYNQVYYIYSTMLVKYVLRTFKKNDEYKLTFESMVELLSDFDVRRIVEKADFSPSNEYIKKAGELIQNCEYKKLYDYAESIREVVI